MQTQPTPSLRMLLGFARRYEDRTMSAVSWDGKSAPSHFLCTRASVECWAGGYGEEVEEQILPWNWRLAPDN